MIVRSYALVCSMCLLAAAGMTSMTARAAEATAGASYEIPIPAKVTKSVTPPERFAKAGKIVICTELGNPPGGFLDEDGVTPKGFNVDVMSAIGPAMGIKTQVVNYPFADIFAALDSGKCDVVMDSSAKSPARVARYNFVPYMLMQLGLMVPKGNPLGLKNFDDLSGHRAAVLVSSTTERLLKAASAKAVAEGKKPIEIQSYPQNTVVFRQLQLGRVDAFVGDAMTMGYFMNLIKDKFQLGGLPVAPLTIGFVMRKDDQEADTAIRQSYVALYDSGYVAQAARKWGMEGLVTLCRDDKQCP